MFALAAPGKRKRAQSLSQVAYLLHGSGVAQPYRHVIAQLGILYPSSQWCTWNGRHGSGRPASDQLPAAAFFFGF
jgi:hypothetical protein